MSTRVQPFYGSSCLQLLAIVQCESDESGSQERDGKGKVRMISGGLSRTQRGEEPSAEGSERVRDARERRASYLIWEADTKAP